MKKLTEYLKELTEEESILFLILDTDDTNNEKLKDKYDKFILEHETYKKFSPTKCVYRLDKANNAKGQQCHVHVFSDKNHNNQLYAINIDGTPHDGSKYQLNKKHQEALKKIGFIVPKDGLLEWKDWGKCQLILD